MEKLHIEKNTVQETLIIPLYGRKLCSEMYPTLFKDERAVELVERIDYDFEPLVESSKGFMQNYGALEIAMRQNDLAFEVRDYLEKNPEAAVVNLGCGLDFTGENCDNGKCRIYNIDMPDIIDIRNRLMPAEDRTKNIAADLNDTKWFEEIDGSKGAVFFAAGVFYYFKSEEMQKLINAMAEHFKGGRLVFDSCGKTALKMMLKSWVKEAGMDSVGAFFHVADVEKDIKPWLKNAEVSSRGYMLGYNDLKDKSIKSSYRTISKFADKNLHLKIVKIEFNK